MLVTTHRSRALAGLLIVVLPVVGLPVLAAPTPATIEGTIFDSVDGAALAGARLHAADPGTERIFSSGWTAADGHFSLELPAGTYLLAVESRGGLYTVGGPLQLAAQSSRTLHLTVAPHTAGNAASTTAETDALWGRLNNPLVAALTVAGIATLIGFLLDDDDKRPRSVSEMEPN